MSHDADQIPATTMTRARAHEEVRLHPGALELEVVEGEDKGAVFRPEGRRIVVGRAPQCDVTLADSSVSSKHLELVLGPDEVVVRDLGSRNGTWVGKVRIQEGLLADGAEFRAGRCLLRLTSVRMQPCLVSSRRAFGGVLGQGEKMRTLFAWVERLATTTLPLLILGETGTGKSELAKAIHGMSGRTGEFVARNCATIPASLAVPELFGHSAGAYTGATEAREGAFGLANGGTLFLDEIGELSLDVQTMLLTVLDNGFVQPLGEQRPKRVDVRLVAATNRDLEQDVEKGRFRADLYQRLEGGSAIVLPPLRERKEDIPLLVQHFVDELRVREQRPMDISDEVFEVLRARHWEGNVRQLKNVIVRSFLCSRGTTLTADDLVLPGRRAQPPPSELPFVELTLKDATQKYKLAYCQHALSRAGGDIQAAAQFAAYTIPGFKNILSKST